MKKMIGASSFALALLLAGCGDGGGNTSGVNMQAPLQRIAAPNNGNWADVVSATPEGGFRIGNPDAPVKLVEYGSLTCPACRAFAEAGNDPLINTYIPSGQVSWEFRPLIIHGAADVALSMLAACMPPAAYFRTIDQIYQQQPEILNRFPEEEQRAVQSLPPEQQVAAAAQGMELSGFFAQRGMPSSRFNQCLADTAAAQRIAETTNRAMTQENVRGTPTFFINGEQVDAGRWNELEPLLRQRIGG